MAFHFTLADSTRVRYATGSIMYFAQGIPQGLLSIAIPVWLASIVILRDVVIVAGATAYNFFVKPVPGEPTRISKLNTALQMLFVVFVLSRAGFGWPDKITITVLGASILATVVISGVDYVLSWSRRARAGE